MGLGDYFFGRPTAQEAPQSSTDSVTTYRYGELEKATKKFNSLIRHGEFGVVNKAVLNGKVLAVQTLQREKKGEKQHKYFARAISTLDHKNILKLDGYCIDKRGSFLCYEHQQPYQTLEDCLIGGPCNPHMNWQERLDILKGLCEGLKYLESRKNVIKIQVDLKVSNILLHEDKTTRALIPKLSEFGVSRQLDVDTPAENGGYFAGYFVRRPKEDSSPDIDIASFGIIIMVMVGGLSKTSNKLNPFGEELIAEVTSHFRNKDLAAWRDPFLSKDDCQQEIEECIELALNCTSPYKTMRPGVAEMASILADLGGVKEQKNVGGNNHRRYHNLEQKLGHVPTSEGSGLIKVDHLREYGYDDLRSATDNFADHCEIGRGVFGIVYKAVIHDKVIAVKKLQKEKFSDQFLNEVSILTALRHKNLVKLEGYCFNSHGTMLCYEYLPGGTLHDRLRAGENDKLSWKQRHHIIQGICKGLQYLHDESPDGVRIVHMDLKTDNILVHVDTNGVLTPKIGDFGISWPLDSNKQHEYVDNPAGNINCTPPEYHVDGKISTGVDIYSFGLIMLEMIIGDQPTPNADKQSRYGRRIVNQVTKHKNKNDLYKLVDQSLGSAYQEEIYECIEIALDCVQSDENKRPNIAHLSLRLAQLGEAKVGKPLRRSNASKRSIRAEKEKSSIHDLEKATLGHEEVIVPNNMLAAKKDGSLEEQQHEALPTIYPEEASTEKSKTHASSMAACNYLCIDATPTEASRDASAGQSRPTSDLLDFTLDFDAIYQKEEASGGEFGSLVTEEKETERDVKRLHEALRGLFPHQIAESSSFIQEMVDKILTNGGCAASDDLQINLMDLVALSKEEDAIKRASDRAARQAEMEEKESQCFKLKAAMQQHFVQAKKLAKQQAQLEKRKEMLQSELERISSELKELPASIADEQNMGMAAQAEGRRLAEQVVKEKAEIGDTSADDALLAQVRKVQKSVCFQLEGIIQKS